MARDVQAEDSSQDFLPQSYTLPKNVKFGFHPVTGRNIVLSDDRLTAKRVKPRHGLGGCIAYGEKPLEGMAELEIEITNYDNAELSASIRIGVMKMKFSSQLTQEAVPRYSEDGDEYCVFLDRDIFNNFTGEDDFDDLIAKKLKWKRKMYALPRPYVHYSPTSLKELTVGDRVGMHLTKDGDLAFLINDQSLGRAASNIYWEGYKVYPVVDIIGKCCGVKITRAEMEVELNLQELCIEIIARSCSSLSDVQSLPLPSKLKDRVCLYTDY